MLSDETSVNLCLSMRRHIPKDSTPCSYTYRLQNVKSDVKSKQVLDICGGEFKGRDPLGSDDA
jgi:hypothetical protein